MGIGNDRGMRRHILWAGASIGAMILVAIFVPRGWSIALGIGTLLILLDVSLVFFGIQPYCAWRGAAKRWVQQHIRRLHDRLMRRPPQKGKRFPSPGSYRMPQLPPSQQTVLVGQNQAGRPVLAPGTAPVAEQPSATGKIAAKPVICRVLPNETVSNGSLRGLKKLGSGGEATVYKVGGDRVWKMFHFPNDAVYAGDEPDQRRARELAAERLADYPRKLAEFPPWLGSRVIAPQRILQAGGYPVGGYEMLLVKGGVPLRNYTKRRWKKRNGVSDDDVARIFLDLYDTVAELHACGVIIGDFKPDNVLVVDHSKAFVVDAESMGYGDYRCRTYSEGYVDPQLCDPRLDYELLIKPHSRASDWYAFTVMLFQALSNLNPYEGVYQPPPGRPPVLPSQRALKGISVFNKHVVVPNFGQSIEPLPDDLEHYFFNVFESGLRERPERRLIEAILPVRAAEAFSPPQQTCWAKFMIPADPECEPKGIDLPAAYTGSGKLLTARVIDGKLACLAKQDGRIVREDGSVVLEDDDGNFNTFIVGRSGIVFGMDLDNTKFQAYDGPFYYVPQEGQAIKVPQVDPAPNGSPNLALVGKQLVWLQEGKLRVSDRKRFRAKFQGSLTLCGGEKFSLIMATERGQLTDLFFLNKSSVSRLTSLPPIMGEIQAAECVFSARAAWLFLTVKWQETVTRYVMVFNGNGTLVGLGHAPDEEHRWFSQGALKAAYEPHGGQKTYELAALTQLGLVRVACSNLQIVPQLVQQWTAAGEPTQLLATSGGLIVCVPGRAVSSIATTDSPAPPEADSKDKEVAGQVSGS